MSFKLTINKEDCIGCGACAAVCENWKIGSDGKAYPLEEQVEDIGCNQEAADNCPVSVIQVTEE